MSRPGEQFSCAREAHGNGARIPRIVSPTARQRELTRSRKFY
jgi:hypothetical protein